ncbi:MAG: prepilin peptidase [Deltaproteobacteria bacterium]|nr:prepilin peptidase [Deltaproteobacteria bacterium]
MEPVFWGVVGFGWLWGSFLSQVADRWPGGGAPAGVGWFFPARSVCFACGRTIPWYHNLPVISWLWLKGRCARCGSPIGWPTLAVESATPVVLGGAYGVWGVSWVTLAAFGGLSAGMVWLALRLKQQGR